MHPVWVCAASCGKATLPLKDLNTFNPPKKSPTVCSHTSELKQKLLRNRGSKASATAQVDMLKFQVTRPFFYKDWLFFDKSEY